MSREVIVDHKIPDISVFSIFRVIWPPPPVLGGKSCGMMYVSKLSGDESNFGSIPALA